MLFKNPFPIYVATCAYHHIQYNDINGLVQEKK